MPHVVTGHQTRVQVSPGGLVRAERVAEHAPKHRPWLKAPSIGWVSSLATLKEAIEKLKSEYS